MTFIVRDAHPRDLATIGELAGRLVRMHHDYDPSRWMLVEGVEAGYEQYFASQIENPDTIILVAEVQESGEIVGYCYASIEGRNWPDLRDACGRLHDVFIAEHARRQGLARAMLRESLRRLVALGAPLAVSTTAWQNETSQALLRSMGFRPAVVEMVKDLE